MEIEELYQIAHGAEIAIDPQYLAEMSTNPPQNAPSVEDMKMEELPDHQLSVPQARAILAVKLASLVKLKKLVSRKTVEYYTEALNKKYELPNRSDVFAGTIASQANGSGVVLSGKELIILQNRVLT